MAYYRAQNHPISPEYDRQDNPLNRADFCDRTGELVRCPKCHAFEMQREKKNDNVSFYCQRCYTFYANSGHNGDINPKRMRDIMGVYRDFQQVIQAIDREVKSNVNVIVLSNSKANSLFLAVGLWLYKGGMCFDDDPGAANRELVQYVWGEMTNDRSRYPKSTYRWITQYGDVKSHLRLDKQVSPLIIRRSVTPLRLQDVTEMQHAHGNAEWEDHMKPLVQKGGTVTIHALHPEDFKSDSAMAYLVEQMINYRDQLKPSPSIYVPSTTIALK